MNKEEQLESLIKLTAHIMGDVKYEIRMSYRTYQDFSMEMYEITNQTFNKEGSAMFFMGVLIKSVNSWKGYGYAILETNET